MRAIDLMLFWRSRKAIRSGSPADSKSMTLVNRVHPSSEFAPTTSNDRIESLDVLRGLALFMILAANMPAFNSPIYYLDQAGQHLWLSRVDHLVDTFVFLFIQNESVSLFSFLFGLGFAMQLIRARSYGAPFTLLYTRKLLALILIGLIHAYLIWMGDILVVYGVLGFLLLLFSNMRLKVILLLAVMFYLVPPARWELSLVRHLKGGAKTVDTAVQGANQMSAQQEAQWEVEMSMHAYAHGTWREITVQRARDYLFYLKHNQAPTVFPLFLFGLYAGRRGLFSNLDSRRRLFRSVVGFSFTVALLGSILLRLLYLQTIPPWAVLLRPLIYAVEHAALIVFYISGIALIHGNMRVQRWMKPLAAAGRLTLSNYLLQSIICTLIFYHYGFGLYGRVGPAGGLVLAVIIFAFQIYLSMLWSRAFRYGPIEWFWRSITYWRSQDARV
jgi:uncharacterized protein